MIGPLASLLPFSERMSKCQEKASMGVNSIATSWGTESAKICYPAMQANGRDAKSPVRGLLDTWWWSHMAVWMSQGLSSLLSTVSTAITVLTLVMEWEQGCIYNRRWLFLSLLPGRDGIPQWNELVFSTDCPSISALHLTFLCESVLFYPSLPLP